MSTLITAELTGPEYFIEPYPVDGHRVSIAAAQEIDDPAIVDMHFALVAAVNASINAVIADITGNEVVSCPPHEVEDNRRWYADSVTVGDLPDDQIDAIAEAGAQAWTQELDNQCAALARAIIAHAASCDDDWCDCGRAIQ